MQNYPAGAIMRHETGKFIKYAAHVVSYSKPGMAQVRLIERFCQLLQSIFPVLRVPMQVHDSKDEENIFIDSIDNAIGKTTNLTAPDIVFKYRPSFWKTEDVLEGGTSMAKS